VDVDHVEVLNPVVVAVVDIAVNGGQYFNPRMARLVGVKEIRPVPKPAIGNVRIKADFVADVPNNREFAEPIEGLGHKRVLQGHQLGVTGIVEMVVAVCVGDTAGQAG